MSAPSASDKPNCDASHAVPKQNRTIAPVNSSRLRSCDDVSQDAPA